MAEQGQRGFEDLECYLRFYYIARGSLDETLSGFVICDDVEYTSGELPDQRELCHSALRSLNGCIRYVRQKQQGHREYGDQLVSEESSAYVVVPGLPEE